MIFVPCVDFLKERFALHELFFDLFALRDFVFNFKFFFLNPPLRLRFSRDHDQADPP